MAATVSFVNVHSCTAIHQISIVVFNHLLISEMEVADSKDRTRGSVRGEAKFSLQLPANTESFDFTDDIDAKAWLTEINLAQYTETFLVNLSADQKHIRRKRLMQLRQQDFCAMNITNFAHQKRLMEHVRLVLKFPFHSPHRKKEVKDLYIEPIPMDLRSVSTDPEHESKSHVSAKVSKASEAKSTVSKANPALEKKRQARRRRSFDADVWNSISNMRKKSVNNAAMADQIRAGLFSNTEDPKPSAPNNDNRRGSLGAGGIDVPGGATRDRQRRWSFHGNDAESHTALVQAGMERARAMMYGNMALEYDIMLTNLHTLQTEVLNKFKETIGCEVASLFFVNNKTRELLLCTAESRWYRVPFGVGICGYCMETGENVNIPDAYADYRFNSNMDKKTGFKTRSILCQPIRGMRGGGAIIGVIQMLNKIGGDGTFDSNDEEMLATFAGKVADMLSVRFTDLINIADKFSGHAMFVGAKGGALGDKANGYTAPTQSSSNKYSRGSSRGDLKADADAAEAEEK